MSLIEKNISNFIETQFPEIYREEGPMFVEFVKKYYEWMENETVASNGAVTYYSRRILDYKDVDETVDNFILHFKEKYLKEIQLDTVSQTRQLIKHSLDLYRSKGTERAVDLFFRSVFGRPAEVYYPGEDVFRLSDGKWVKPKYLEVTPSEYNNIFVGKQVIGINTGATAFVERYIKRKVKNKYMHILYISSIVGEFETGELLTLEGQNLKNIPTIIGSLTTLDVVTGSSNFKIGDIVNLQSNNGLQGKARVANISDITGIVDFELQDSGWGYSSSANVLVSEKVLFLENVIPLANNTGKTTFQIFESVKQPQANIVYKNANATISFTKGDFIYTYYANNTQAGKGVVVAAANTTTTNGEVYVVELEGKLSPVVEPAASNSSGTVSITTLVGPVSGYASINTTSANLVGTGTSFTTQLTPNTVIKIFAYNSNNELLGIDYKLVVSVTNNTIATLESNLNYTSANAIIQFLGNRSVTGSGTAFNTDFVYGDKVAIYSNSSNYIIRTVSSVSNATYMTVQEDMSFTNTSANYAKVVTNNYIYTSSNTVKANIHSYSDKTATGNVIGSGASLTLYLTNTNGTFVKSQRVYQKNANNDEIATGFISSVGSIIGTNAVLTVANTRGVFQPNISTDVLYSTYANGVVSANAQVKQIDMTVGLVSVTNVFLNDYFVVGNTSSSNANLKKISSGVFANFDTSNTLQYAETLTLLSDRVEDYQYIPLDSISYGFPKLPTANGSTQYLNDILRQTQIQIGGIASLVSVNPGKNYDTAPYVLIYEPNIAPFNRTDYTLDISNVSAPFAVGEVVSQPNTAAVGIVKSANSTNMILKRIQFENQFDTSNGLIGTSSGATANILSIASLDNAIQIGLNANVTANVQTAAGSVTLLEVVDSGFGYLPGEDVDFISVDGLRSGLAKVKLGKKGVSEGFYKNKNGFISAGKKIYDGEYYQDYSYEIRTSVTADKYTEMLKKVLHVAGTKEFSAVVLSGSTNVSTNIKTDITEE